LFSNATGASNLRISSKARPTELLRLCQQAYEIYQKNDFKEVFPDIQNILPVKDPTVLQQLNNDLIDAFNNESISLVLTVPEIIDFQDSLDICFSGSGRSLIYEDVFIGHYREYLKSSSIETVNLDSLKTDQLNICDEDGTSTKRFPIYKCLLFDCEKDGNYFHLCEGNWYQVEKSYMDRLQSGLDPYFEDHTFSEFNHKSESAYNQFVAKNDTKYICLDETNIAPKGQTQVEPCDLYSVDKGIARFCHVKISTRSSTLSHLFNQGVNAIELIKLDQEAKRRLCDLIKRDPNGNDVSIYLSPLEKDQAEIIYVIVTHKDKGKKSRNLPLFSRISLMRCIKSLKVMSIRIAIWFVEDKSEKKPGKEKASKKKNSC